MESSNYYHKLIQGLEDKNRELAKQGEAQAKQIEQLESALQDAKRRLTDGEQIIQKLEKEIVHKDTLLAEKNDIIRQISEQVAQYGAEMDRLMSAVSDIFAKNHARPEPAVHRQEMAPAWDGEPIGTDKDLLFGVNLEDDFVRHSDSDVIRYYLYATESTQYYSFELEGLELKTRPEHRMVGKSLASFLSQRAKHYGYEIQGVLEMCLAEENQFPSVRYWGNHIDWVHELMLEFRDRFGLKGSLRYNSLALADSF